MLHRSAQIPALPVLLPLLLIGIAAVVWRLHRTGAATVPRVAVGVVACLYAAGVLRAVLLPMPIHLGADGNQVAWWVWLQPIPLLTADPTGIVLNVALFVPFGLLLPLMARVASVRQTAMIGLAVSLAIEVTQFIADVTVSGGRVADVDDLIANTLGAVVGFALFRLATALPIIARTVTALTWPPARRPSVPAAARPLADVGH